MHAHAYSTGNHASFACSCRDAFFSLMKEASALMRSLPPAAMDALSQVITLTAERQQKAQH